MPSFLNQISSYLSTAQNIVSGVNNLLENGLSSLISGGWSGEREDFNAMRQMAHKLVRTQFQPEWLFRLDVAGAPADFDLYVKDITYSHFDIQTDDEQIGSATMSWPTAEQALQISMTVRDNVDQRVANFLRAWAHQVIHPDGTVGLPYGTDGYVRNVLVYTQSPGGTEHLVCSREMYPIQCGEVTQSRENSAWMEIPVTFTQFTNLSVAASTLASSITSGNSKNTNTSNTSNSTK